MFNNKKSLLQRARIAMLAIVTIIGFGSAFAMTPAHNRADATYGVIQTVAGGYRVTAAADGDCSGTNHTCKIVSATPPDEDGFISSDNVSQSLPGVYSPANSR